MADLTTVILAAGKGTRMKSSLPKVLHKAGGKAMLAHVLAAAKEAGAVRNIVVVGFGGETVEKALAGEADFVTQEEQLGTGHAVLQAEPLLHEETGTVLVLCGDTPLLTGKLLKKLAKEHAASGAKATVLTAVMPDATGYGRIIRAADGTVERIVEHKDATVIGEGCEIGPDSRFQDVKIGAHVTAHFCYAHECEIADGATLGPYVHLRPATKIAAHVKIGNFVEVKNSVVGEGTKLPHLSYIGDSDIGAGVNMGCGTITVNYDGRQKFRTKVGDGAFVGCNSNLVAPVSVGDGAYIGAGSTITKDIPAGDLAIARAHQKNITGWADKRKEEMEATGK